MKAPEELRAEVGRLIHTIKTTTHRPVKEALAEQAFELAQQAEFAERESQKLRRLATWYREFAERAGSSLIWESRLLMADALEKEADILEGKDTHRSYVRAD